MAAKKKIHAQMKENELDSFLQNLREHMIAEGKTELVVDHDTTKDWIDGFERDLYTTKRIQLRYKTHLQQRGIDIAYREEGYFFKADDSFINGTITAGEEEHTPKKKFVPRTEISDELKNLVASDGERFTQTTHIYVAPTPFQDVKTAVEAGMMPYLYGDFGCGKSALLEYIFETLNIPFIRKSLGNVSKTSELLGQFQIVEEDGVSITKFVYGLIPLCAENGVAIIFDEVDSMPPHINTVFQQITEIGGQMVLQTEKGPEKVAVHPNFRMAFTGNTSGYGDSTGMYPNCLSQNHSLLDRIRPKIHMEYESKTEKSVLVINKMLPEALINVLYTEDGDPAKRGLVQLIRDAIEKGTLKARLSFRTILGFAEMYKLYRDKGVEYGWHKAMTYGFLADFNPVIHNDIKDIIRGRLTSACVPTISKTFIARNADECKKQLGMNN